ncbi:hypothetical protein QPK87_30030 [Kamptonema cortianum]|nr:hypothetical protein [Kamptonema cortianum]
MADRRVTYYAPDSKVIRQIVRDACQQFSEEQNNAAYAAPEFVNGLTECLHLVARLMVKYMNGGGRESLDNSSS